MVCTFNIFQLFSTDTLSTHIVMQIVWWSCAVAISSSSPEAKYHNLGSNVAETVWLWSLLQELELKCNTPIVYCDNQSVVAFSHNPVLRSKTKDMELDNIFVRERMLNHSWLVCHVHVAEQVTNSDQIPLSSLIFFSKTQTRDWKESITLSLRMTVIIIYIYIYIYIW